MQRVAELEDRLRDGDVMLKNKMAEVEHLNLFEIHRSVSAGRVIELESLLANSISRFSDLQSVCDSLRKQVVELQHEPLRLSVRRAQAELDASKQQLASLKVTDVAKFRLREHGLKQQLAELEQSLQKERSQTHLLQKSLVESQTALRQLETQIMQSHMQRKTRQPVGRAASADAESPSAQRCKALEGRVLAYEQQVIDLQQQLNIHRSSAAAADAFDGSLMHAAAGASRPCCDGYRRRCEALQASLGAEQLKSAALSRQLSDSNASCAASAAKIQMLVNELSARNAAMTALESSCKQQMCDTLRSSLNAAEETIRVMQEQAEDSLRVIGALEAKLNVADAAIASSTAAQSEAAHDAARHTSDLESRLQQTQLQLTDTLRLLDEQLERTAVAEMTCIDRGCSSCAESQRHAASVESQLAVALGDLDALSRDHARTLRHAASALQEMQQQLLAAREREVEVEGILRDKEEEYRNCKQVMIELGAKEQQGLALRALHAEAAEVFLQQAQAMQSSGRVCFNCLAVLEQPGL